jgi:hypothetical protein
MPETRKMHGIFLLAPSMIIASAAAHPTHLKSSASVSQLRVIKKTLADTLSTIDLPDRQERSFAIRDPKNGKMWIVSNINLEPYSIDLQTLENVVRANDEALQTCKFDPRFPNFRGPISAKAAEFWQILHPDIEPPRFGFIEKVPKKKIRCAGLKGWFNRRRQCGYVKIDSHED